MPRACIAAAVAVGETAIAPEEVAVEEVAVEEEEVRMLTHLPSDTNAQTCRGVTHCRESL